MTSPEHIQKLEELFHEALKLPTSDRQTFLDVRCAGDESLRRQIESLLSEDAHLSGVLEGASCVKRESSKLPSLSIGSRLGTYEITGFLASGGMGEVYRAKDTKLNRVVAVKVLPGAFAVSPERIARLRREAQLLASLNHPSIAALYALEESENGLALIMELVEGATLSERIRKGPIPFADTVGISRQIAEALEAAHERGIIHRDLKAANVKVTPEGRVKILDFGLGTTVKLDPARHDAVSSAMLTRAGLILGSPAYMSPEQARGAAVDRRTDVWAFGVLLYEMLTGERPFPGKTPSDILAAVLTSEPDWDPIPLEAQYSLRLCLQKDPQQRMRDIWDASCLLGQQPVRDAPVWRNHWRICPVVALVVALALWLSWGAMRPAAAKLERLVRFDVDLGADLPPGAGRGPDVILSRDGLRFVYVSGSKLFTRILDQSLATELGGTEGAYDPFFSPDGEWVAFFTPGKLKKVSVRGGSPITLCDTGLSSGGTWGEDGNIIAAIDVFGLSRVPAGGGVPTKLTELGPGEAIHRWPQIMPGGAVLFSVYRSAIGLQGARIEVVFPESRRRKIIRQNTGWARYLGSGHLAWLENSQLLAAPFDLKRMDLEGAASVMLTDVSYTALTGAAQIDVSPAGTLVYRSSHAAAQLRTVQWLEGAETTRSLLDRPGYYVDPRLSPDGERLVVSSAGDVWVHELRRETMTRLTFDGGYTNPLWSIDGRFIVFRGPGGIRWMRADGAGQPNALTSGENMQVPSSFSPDGKRLAFVEVSSATGADIWTVPVERDGDSLRAGKPEIFLRTGFNERAPAFSPDGRRIAYSSDETGTLDVYIRDFPDRGGKVQISSGGGNFPVWSRDRTELFFTNGDRDNQLMSARYRIEGHLLRPEKLRPWSGIALPFSPPSRNFDVSRNGKLIAVLPARTSERETAQRHIVVVLHFLDELQRRVPHPRNGRDASQ